MNIEKEKIVDWIMNPDCLNENGDLEVLNHVGGLKEVLNREKVKEIVENLKSFNDLEELIMNRLECDGGFSFGEILDDIIDN